MPKQDAKRNEKETRYPRIACLPLYGRKGKRDTKSILNMSNLDTNLSSRFKICPIKLVTDLLSA